MHDLNPLRAYMAIVFVGIAAGQWFARGGLAHGGGYLCAQSLDDVAQGRLESAVCARMRAEATPVGAIGGLLAGLSLLMAALAVFTPLPVQLLYAANVFASAVALTLTFRRLRRAQRRVAALAPRDPDAVVPGYISMLVAVSVVLPLLWLPAQPVAASLVTAAGIGIALLARAVAAMPALLSGEDIVVETYVDGRLRAVRAATLSALAVGPGYVFAALSGSDSPVRAVAILKEASIVFGFIVVGVTAARLFALAWRRPTGRDAASW